MCRYPEKRIELSVSFCLCAPRREVQDALLHEVAHAIVGPQHGHDAVWRAKARALGCSGKRCHDLTHSIPGWRGSCGCGPVWRRHRLQCQVPEEGLCPSYRTKIKWRENIRDIRGRGGAPAWVMATESRRPHGPGAVRPRHQQIGGFTRVSCTERSHSFLALVASLARGAGAVRLAE